MGDGDSCQRQSFNNNNTGFHKWCTCEDGESYKGEICFNALHDEGVYKRIKDGESYIYEGSFYANNFEGYARVMAEDSTYFEGLFKSNKRFGPGVLTYKDGTQDVGMWLGFDLIRLSRLVEPEWIPRLGRSDSGKAKVLKYREIVPIENKLSRSNATEVLNAIRTHWSHNCSDGITLDDLVSEKLYNKKVRNKNSLFFDKRSFDEKYFRDFDYYIDVVADEDILYTQETRPSHIESDPAPPCVEDVLEILCDIVDKIDYGECKLIEQRYKTLRMIANHNTYQAPCLKYLRTKQVRVTHILAWNNTELLIEILQHTFLHRKRENLVNFDVDALVTGKRGTFAEIGNYELACARFLSNCSHGDLITIKKSRRRCNPDVSDARGNTGVMYAAARDKVQVVKYLTEIGANLDYINDEGLTPLGMCLLRYLAVLDGVSNWEKGFLLDPKEKFAPGINQIWRERASLVNLAIQSCLNDLGKPVESDDFSCTGIGFEEWFTHDMYLLYNLLNLKKPEGGEQDFQSRYDYDPNSRQEYILKTSFPIKTKPKIDANVVVVFNTISVLLHCGADPNLSNVPLPALIMGLFIGDPSIYQKLLEYKANANVQYGEDKLTPLHVLTSLPLNSNLVIICRLLLDHGADPNLRCSNSHWPEQTTKLIGKFKGLVIDEGKTPLHILAMREDLSPQDGCYFNEIAKALITRDGSLSSSYLGHVPLSLAVLKGNLNLVDRFLKMGDDPNRILGNDLGTPLTIYTLKRYSNKLPPLKDRILDLLVAHGGCVLGRIGQCRNVCEFMVNEGVKGKEVVVKYIDLMKAEVLKYYRTKALLFILQTIDDDVDVNFSKNVARFLTPHQALIRMNFFIDKDLISSRRIIEKVFDFVIRNGNNNKHESVSSMMTRLELYEGDESFGFDQNEDDHVVCFNCGLKTNKVLLACQKCGLVYFCSEICNRADGSGKSTHPCRSLFYNREFANYKKCLASGIPYAANDIGGIRDLVGQLGQISSKKTETFDDDDSKNPVKSVSFTRKQTGSKGVFDIHKIRDKYGNRFARFRSKQEKQEADLSEETGGRKFITRDKFGNVMIAKQESSLVSGTGRTYTEDYLKRKQEGASKSRPYNTLESRGTTYIDKDRFLKRKDEGRKHRAGTEYTDDEKRLKMKKDGKYNTDDGKKEGMHKRGKSKSRPYNSSTESTGSAYGDNEKLLKTKNEGKNKRGKSETRHYESTERTGATSGDNEKYSKKKKEGKDDRGKSKSRPYKSSTESTGSAYGDNEKLLKTKNEGKNKRGKSETKPYESTERTGATSGDNEKYSKKKKEGKDDRGKSKSRPYKSSTESTGSAYGDNEKLLKTKKEGEDKRGKSKSRPYSIERIGTTYLDKEKYSKRKKEGKDDRGRYRPETKSPKPTGRTSTDHEKYLKRKGAPSNLSARRTTAINSPKPTGTTSKHHENFLKSKGTPYNLRARRTTETNSPEPIRITPGDYENYLKPYSEPHNLSAHRTTGTDFKKFDYKVNKTTPQNTPEFDDDTYGPPSPDNKNTLAGTEVALLKHDKHPAPCFTTYKLSQEHQDFLQQLSNLCPEFDSFGILKPFVCFREGQLYYKFPSVNKKSALYITYTSS